MTPLRTLLFILLPSTTIAPGAGAHEPGGPQPSNGKLSHVSD